MKMLAKLAASAALAVTALAVSATTASAMIVCNNEGECWHVRHHHYHFRPEFGLVVHEDNWRWADTDHFRWREHTGRGYWKNGVWIRF